MRLVAIVFAIVFAILGAVWEGIGIYVLFEGEPTGMNWDGLIGLQMITVVLFLGSIAFSLIAKNRD